MLAGLDSPAGPGLPLVACHDPNQTYTFSVLTPTAANGIAGVVNNQLTYTPDNGFSGLDTFQFRATQVGSGLMVDGYAVVFVSATRSAAGGWTDYRSPGYPGSPR